jgi:hypothetical protein
MAKVVKFLKGSPHFNPLQALGDAVEGDVITATATRITVVSDAGHKIVFHGNFTVAGQNVIGGTMTGFDVYVGSTKVMKARDYNTQATDVGDAVNAGFGDFLSLVFGGARIVGSKAGDLIYVPAGAKVLGGGGNDTLFAFQPGKVVLKGGDGDDVMTGSGMARMSGGDGDDIFIFNYTVGSDRAKDFNVKDDVVGLSHGMFNADVKVGFLGDAYFRIGKQAKTPTEYILYDKKTGILSLDQDGSGGGFAPKQIGILPDHLKLKAKDFLVGDFI